MNVPPAAAGPCSPNREISSSWEIDDAPIIISRHENSDSVGKKYRNRNHRLRSRPSIRTSATDTTDKNDPQYSSRKKKKSKGKNKNKRPSQNEKRRLQSHKIQLDLGNLFQITEEEQQEPSSSQELPPPTSSAADNGVHEPIERLSPIEDFFERAVNLQVRIDALASELRSKRQSPSNGLISPLAAPPSDPGTTGRDRTPLTDSFYQLDVKISDDVPRSRWSSA